MNHLRDETYLHICGSIVVVQVPGPTLCRADASAQVASYYVERIDLASKLRELNKKMALESAIF